MRALIALALVAAGCSSLHDGEEMYTPIPPLKLMSSTPAGGATDVTLADPIILQFNDFPDPGKVSSMQLLAGTTVVAAAPTVDLVGKSVSLLPGQPLAPNTLYTVTLPAAAGTNPLRGLNGGALEGATQDAAAVSFQFTTGTRQGTGPVAPPIYTLATDIQPLFDFIASLPGTDGGVQDSSYLRCASLTGGCHSTGMTTVPAMPANNLDLTDGNAHASLLEQPSFSSNLPRVIPGDPANSYLLRKLLGTPDIEGYQMPLGETDQWPPENTRMISDWILTGAQ